MYGYGGPRSFSDCNVATVIQFQISFRKKEVMLSRFWDNNKPKHAATGSIELLSEVRNVFSIKKNKNEKEINK